MLSACSSQHQFQLAVHQLAGMKQFVVLAVVVALSMVAGSGLAAETSKDQSADTSRYVGYGAGGLGATAFGSGYSRGRYGGYGGGLRGDGFGAGYPGAYPGYDGAYGAYDRAGSYRYGSGIGGPLRRAYGGYGSRAYPSTGYGYGQGGSYQGRLTGNYNGGYY